MSTIQKYRKQTMLQYYAKRIRVRLIRHTENRKNDKE